MAGKKMPVSERAVYQRINRKLAKQGQLLKALRHPDLDVGKYYIIDVRRNILLRKQVNLENAARELGLLAQWEEVR
jgi:hypothetical protein